MSTVIEDQSYSVFKDNTLLAQGALENVVLKLKHAQTELTTSTFLVFSDLTGKEMDFDLRGSDQDVLDRLEVYLPRPEKSEASGPGRPKLGVVAREVSLLPRHWEWLSTQSGGASATLRRLIEDAKKQLSGPDKIKQAQERAYKFMSVMAGNLPGYEEALRALYAKDKEKLIMQMANWPEDIQTYTLKLAAPVFKRITL